MANCSVCLEIFREPTTCIPCGHMFCNRCICNWRRTHSESNICPQCRRPIKDLQRVYLGDPANLVVSEQTSPLFHFTGERYQWFCELYQTTFRRLNDWRQRVFIDNEDDNQIEDHAQTFFNNVHHAKERMRTAIQELGTSQKCMILFSVFLLLSLIIQDAQSPSGFLHGLILPLLQIIQEFISSIISTLIFIFLRPLYCLWNIFSELLLTVFEIVYTIFYAVFYCIWTVLLIPYAVVSAISMWCFNMCCYFFETVIAILQLTVISCVVGVSYLFLVDLNQREEAIDLLLRKYHSIRSALPTKRQAQQFLHSCQSQCVAFVNSFKRKAVEPNTFAG